MVALTQLPATESSPAFQASMANLVKSIQASLPKTSPAPSTTSGSASRDASPSGSDQEPQLCSISAQAPQLGVEAPCQESERLRLLAEVAAEVRRTVEAEAEQKFRDAWRRCEGIYEGIARQQATQRDALEHRLQLVLGTQAEVEKENQMLRQTVQLLASRLDQALESGALQRAARAREPSQEPSVCHTVLLCRAEGESIGLDLAPGSDRLEVAKVLSGGAAEAWNRQASQSQRILSGDRLVSVNGVATADAMIQELRLRRMLKIKIQRGGDRQCDRARRGIA